MTTATPPEPLLPTGGDYVSLDERLVAVWRTLALRGRARCLVCGSETGVKRALPHLRLLTLLEAFPRPLAGVPGFAVPSMASPLRPCQEPRAMA